MTNPDSNGELSEGFTNSGMAMNSGAKMRPYQFFGYVHMDKSGWLYCKDRLDPEAVSIIEYTRKLRRDLILLWTGLFILLPASLLLMAKWAGLFNV